MHTNIHKEFIAWFKKTIEPRLPSLFNVEYLSEEEGDFGEFEGVQISANFQDGFFYIWSSGMYHMAFRDLKTEEFIIPDTLDEHKNESFDQLLYPWLKKLGLEE